MAIAGDCDPRFEAVKRCFEERFGEEGERGAAVSVTLGGAPVVDLHGGWADVAETTPWSADSIVCVYSVTKGVASAAMALLVDRGELDPDAPVVDVWPEFGACGKAETTLAELASHQAGLSAVREELPPNAWLDVPLVVEALARQEPWWTPGSRIGYHAITWGLLVGEVVRRATGRSLGTVIREDLAGPVDADFHMPTGIEVEDRIAELDGDDGLQLPMLGYWLLTPQHLPMRWKLLSNPSAEECTPSHREWRQKELPAINGFTNARALTRIYSSLVGDDARLSAAALETVTRERVDQRDLLSGMRQRYGFGFMLNAPTLGFGPDPRAFGHTGSGGAVAFADPGTDLCFAFTPNRRRTAKGFLVPTARALIDATYEALGLPGRP